MKHIKPKDLVKPSRPILIDTRGVSREKLKEKLIEALRIRGIRVPDG